MLFAEPSRLRVRWIGWKARPLLRIRYGSEDDARSLAEGADTAGNPRT